MTDIKTMKDVKRDTVFEIILLEKETSIFSFIMTNGINSIWIPNEVKK